MVDIKIVLASKSPRKIEILKKFISDFETDDPNSDEEFDENFDCITNIMSISKNKVEKVICRHPDKIIIAADTSVVIDDKILNKPSDKNEAEEYIRMLSGKKHFVITGFCISDGRRTVCDYTKTYVTFRELDEKMIKTYIDTEDWQDKAGAYGIQSFGALLISEIYGDYYSVMGLPISRIAYFLYKYYGINILEE